MIKIGLFCSAGMSTSLMVQKMELAAEKEGKDVSIKAFPEAEMENHLDEIDVALLGPQIRYLLPKAKEVCNMKNIPIDVISPQDYGMMNGKKVLEQALSLLNI